MKLVKLKNPIMAEKGKPDVNYLFVDTVDTNLHEDITSPEAIDIFGELTGRDYMFVRKELSLLMGDFSTVTDNNHKLIYIKYSLPTKAQALTVVSAKDREENNKEVIEKLKKARSQRVERARQVIGSKLLDGELSYTDTNDLLDSTEDLLEKYIKGANPACVTWLQNDFAAKPCYSVSLKDQLLDIIINGAI